MKTVKLSSLDVCPLCGNKPVLRKNASKDFQVWCKHCHCRTDWLTKPEAIIYWYKTIIAIIKRGNPYPPAHPSDAYDDGKDYEIDE